MRTAERVTKLFNSCYALDVSDRDWLGGILQVVKAVRPVPEVDAGGGGFMFTSSPSGEDFRIREYVAKDVPAEQLDALRRFHGTLDPATIQAKYFGKPLLCGTSSQLGIPASPEQQEVGIADLMGLQAVDHAGIGCCLLFPLARRAALRAAANHFWASVTMHIQASLRLRKRLAGGELWNLVEGVIDVSQPGGQVVHAEGPARAPAAQEALRQVARHIDRIRSAKGLSSEVEVMQAWPILVSGQWTLLEHFESDGRRYYIALRNQRIDRSLVALSNQEYAVTQRAIRGMTNKAIGAELSLHEPTVNTYLHRAMAKLRMSSRAELVGLNREVQCLPVPMGDGGSNGGALMILRAEGDLEPVFKRYGLTKAEKAVALGVMDGLSSKAIAKQRNAKERTVANQLQSIYRKMGIVSRTELVALVTQPASRQPESQPAP